MHRPSLGHVAVFQDIVQALSQTALEIIEC
jgi:hypothetical protein